MVKGREEKSLVISHRALGSLAEGHYREVDFPLLTLSEFSANPGGILQQRVLCTGAMVHWKRHSSIKFIEVAINTVEQHK